MIGPEASAFHDQENLILLRRHEPKRCEACERFTARNCHFMHCAVTGLRGDILKILAWDGSGPVLFAKRLEHGKFVWPPIALEGALADTAAVAGPLAVGETACRLNQENKHSHHTCAGRPRRRRRR